MELLQNISVQKTKLTSFKDIFELWEFCHQHVLDRRMGEIATYWKNIEELSHIDFILEEDFMPEYVFSVYSAGFKASVVTKKFNQLLYAHNIFDANGKFIDALSINRSQQMSYNLALGVIGNKAKAKAIQDTRATIAATGWEAFHRTYLKGKEPEKIRGLPFMGPALSCHVARNLGNVNVAKPDVHLNRLAQHYGIESAQKLCETISGYPAAYNDLVLWLASADHGTR